MDPLPTGPPQDPAAAPQPHRSADPASRALAWSLLQGARHATLAVLDEAGWPMTSRIGLQLGADGVPLALLSDLALHSRALCRDPRAALLIDGPANARGSPLSGPRLSLQVRAAPADPSLRPAQAADWRRRDPKAAIYLGLSDFRFWRLEPVGGLLNAGFGRAHLMTPADLAAPDTPA
ncbi:HugZ family protein [Paracoccus luteus]|uniref:HugZ family pyridoxamine 5'-phosphate oxidase n=1 Tax=Paracoccus luteus TaxID=2508543 RepID=UPI001FEB2551|nr:pyridoxamine 5-phosphate oxidase [Paracoccus luteus]